MEINGIDVKIERIRLGVRQYELAQRAGIRPNELSMFENGHTRLNPEKLDRVMAALGMREAVHA